MLIKLALTPDLRQLLETNCSVENDQADELRDLCNDTLDVCGYDENYMLNEDGKRLEALVDKLFVG